MYLSVYCHTVYTIAGAAQAMHDGNACFVSLINSHCYIIFYSTLPKQNMACLRFLLKSYYFDFPLFYY